MPGFLLKQSGSLYGSGTPGVAGGGLATLDLIAITTGSTQTVTLQRITPTGAAVTVFWGDGGTSTIANGNIGTTTHVYAAAGTYAITITNPSIISYLDLRDAKIVFNSSTLLGCGNALTTVYLSSLRTGCTIRSADMAHLRLSSQLYLSFSQAGTYAIDSADFATYTLSYLLYLYFPQAGTYAIDSADFATYTLSSQLYLYFSQAGTYAIDSADFATYTLSYLLSLYFSQAGTYAIDSAHFATYTLSYLLYLYFSQAGTYAIDSADFATYTLSSQLYLSFSQAGTYAIDSADFAARTTLTNITIALHASATTAIAQADWDGFPALTTLRFEAGLAQAKVTNVLLGLYTGFATRTATAGTIDLLGQSNAAPTGVSPGSAQCPPTTGYNAAYELVNDSCAVNPTKKWTSVTLP